MPKSSHVTKSESENSVLFNLAELGKLERDRVEEEVEARVRAELEARAERERAALEREAQAAREQVEARLRAQLGAFDEEGFYRVEISTVPFNL